jgi:hypothetical protein
VGTAANNDALRRSLFIMAFENIRSIPFAAKGNWFIIESNGTAFLLRTIVQQ